MANSIPDGLSYRQQRKFAKLNLQKAPEFIPPKLNDSLMNPDVNDDDKYLNTDNIVKTKQILQDYLSCTATDQNQKITDLIDKVINDNIKFEEILLAENEAPEFIQFKQISQNEINKEVLARVVKVNNDINHQLRQEVSVKFKEYLDILGENIVKHLIEVLDNRLKVDRYTILEYRKKLLGLLTNSLTHSLTHSPTHPLTHSLTHSLLDELYKTRSASKLLFESYEIEERHRHTEDIRLIVGEIEDETNKQLAAMDKRVNEVNYTNSLVRKQVQVFEEKTHELEGLLAQEQVENKNLSRKIKDLEVKLEQAKKGVRSSMIAKEGSSSSSVSRSQSVVSFGYSSGGVSPPKPKEDATATSKCGNCVKLESEIDLLKSCNAQQRQEICTLQQLNQTTVSQQQHQAVSIQQQHESTLKQRRVVTKESSNNALEQVTGDINPQNDNITAVALSTELTSPILPITNESQASADELKEISFLSTGTLLNDELVPPITAHADGANPVAPAAGTTTESEHKDISNDSKDERFNIGATSLAKDDKDDLNSVHSGISVDPSILIISNIPIERNAAMYDGFDNFDDDIIDSYMNEFVDQALQQTVGSDEVVLGGDFMEASIDELDNENDEIDTELEIVTKNDPYRTVDPTSEQSTYSDPSNIKAIHTISGVGDEFNLSIELESIQSAAKAATSSTNNMHSSFRTTIEPIDPNNKYAEKLSSAIEQNIQLEQSVKEHQAKILSLEYQNSKLNSKLRKDEAYSEKQETINKLRLKERNLLLKALVERMKEMNETIAKYKFIKKSSSAIGLSVTKPQPGRPSTIKLTQNIPVINFGGDIERPSTYNGMSNEVIDSKRPPTTPGVPTVVARIKTAVAYNNENASVGTGPRLPVSDDILHAAIHSNSWIDNQVSEELQSLGFTNINKDTINGIKQLRTQIVTLLVSQVPSRKKKESLMATRLSRDLKLAGREYQLKPFVTGMREPSPPRKEVVVSPPEKIYKKKRQKDIWED